MLHFNTVNWATFSFFTQNVFSFHFPKAWTTRLKSQYSSSSSSYHCCQELQTWAPPAQDHNCILLGSSAELTPLPCWEFFAQQPRIGKSFRKRRKRTKRKGSWHDDYYDLCKYFPLALGICVISPTCPMPPVERWSGESRLAREEFVQSPFTAHFFGSATHCVGNLPRFDFSEPVICSFAGCHLLLALEGAVKKPKAKWKKTPPYSSFSFPFLS